MSEPKLYALVPYALVADLHGVMRILERDGFYVDGKSLTAEDRKHFKRLLGKIHREIRSCHEASL